MVFWVVTPCTEDEDRKVHRKTDILPRHYMASQHYFIILDTLNIYTKHFKGKKASSSSQNLFLPLYFPPKDTNFRNTGTSAIMEVSASLHLVSQVRFITYCLTPYLVNGAS
jgi:hypothetical protein